MKDHMKDFKDFYEELGEDRECWKEVKVIKEKSIAATHDDGKNFTEEQQEHNQVCCLKLKQVTSEEEIEWVVVQQQWLDTDLNIGGEKHDCRTPKRTWEICG